MPIYCFTCVNCKHVFDIEATIAQVEAGELNVDGWLCPKCGCPKTHRLFCPPNIGWNTSGGTGALKG